jgi:hypothetical protein
MTILSNNLSSGLRRRIRRTRLGFTLVEVTIACGILGITILGYVGFLAFTQQRIVFDTQMEIAYASLRERMELFKGVQTFSDIKYSTTANPVYLKRLSNGQWNTNWRVPQLNEWVPFFIEGININANDPPQYNTGNANSTLLPQSQWSVVITQITTGGSTKDQIRATVRWRLRNNAARWHSQSLTTNISADFMNL